MKKMKWLGVICLMLSLLACGLQPVNMVRELTLSTSNESNQHKPLNVDVLMIQNADMLQALKGIRIEQWFVEKDALMKQFNIDAKLLKTYRLLPATQVVFEIDLKQTTKIAVFADYSHAKNKFANVYDASGIEGIEFKKRAYNLIL